MEAPLSQFRRKLPTLVTAAFAMVWVVFRAHLQSVTVDEADTYHFFVELNWQSQWYASSNNHVLNSILIRLFTWLFGLSHLTLRASPLIGAAIYIVAAFRLCRLITKTELQLWLLFVLFVYNPFVMDFMVAARGYGLAMGFLMMELFLVSRQVATYEAGGEKELRHDAMWASACAALSFSANFTFSYATASCLLLFGLWVGWTMRQGYGQNRQTLEKWVRFWIWCAWPGLLIAFLIVGSVIASFPKSQLYYGAKTLSDSYHSIFDSTFSGLNPAIVNPLISRLLQWLAPTLPWLALALTSAQFALFAWPRRNADRSRIVWIAGLAGTALILTFSLHYLQFVFADMPLPFKRTSLFFVPLATMSWGAVTIAERRGRAGRILQRVSLALMFACAGYFLGALRLTHFYEWEFGADVRTAFPEIQHAARRYHVREIPTVWEYTAALNFYRTYYHDQDLDSFRWTLPMPGGYKVYVLPYNDFQDFIRKENLHILYRGPHTQLTILARGDPDK